MLNMDVNVIDKLKKEDYNILVINALSGTFPLALRKKFPKAHIICAEVFPYFVSHLKKLGFEVIMYNKISADMKFDVVVGNPPFSERSNTTNKSKDLDSLIFEKMLSKTDNLHMIIRSKHLTNPKSNFKKRLFSSSRLIRVAHVPEHHFPQITNTETCVISCSASAIKTVIVYKNKVEKIQKLTRDDVILFSDPEYSGIPKNNLSGRWIRGALNRNKIVDTENGIDLVEVMGSGDYPIIRKIEPEIESTGRNQHGVIMNVCAGWGDLGKIFIKPYDAAISSSIVCIKTSSYEESKKMLEYLQSEQIKEIIKKNMASFHPTKALFTNIPELPSNNQD